MNDEKNAKLQMLMMEVMAEERKNLRTKSKSDAQMVAEIANIIKEYSKQRY